MVGKLPGFLYSDINFTPFMNKRKPKHDTKGLAGRVFMRNLLKLVVNTG